MVHIQKILLISILFSFIPIILSAEQEKQSTTNSKNDPFKDLDFGNVLKLDESNFENEYKKNETLYILFYSPDCDHCVLTMPSYIETANYAKEKKLPIKFSAVNAAQSVSISDSFEIKSLPTIYLIYKGKKIRYEGLKDKKNLIKFVDKKDNEDIFKITTLKQVEKYKSDSNLMLLSTLKDKNSVLYKSFEHYSHEAFIVDFVSCPSDECVKKYGEDLTLFKTFDEKINIFSKDFDEIKTTDYNACKKFIGMFGIEAGAMLNVTEINMMFEYGKKVIFYFRNSTNANQTQYDKLFKELGLEFRKQNIYTLILDVEGDKIHKEIAHTFTVLSSELPCYLYYDFNPDRPKEEQMNYYSIRKATPDQLTKEYIKQYVEDIKTNNITKYKTKNSQNEQFQQQQASISDLFKNVDFGHVMKLNESNFLSEVAKNETLFIYFYESQCEHCLNMIPEYIKTANYSVEKKLGIKFSAVEIYQNPNISRLFKIEQYPSIYLMIDGKKLQYGGKIEQYLMLKFVSRKKNDDLFLVTTNKEIETYKSNNTIVLLSTLKDKKTSIYKSFTKYSHEAMYIDFLSCQSKDCIKKYGEDIILFKPFDEKINKYSSDYEELSKAQNDSVKNFVGIFGIETGVVTNVSSISMMIEHNKKILFYFRNSSNPEHTKYDKLFKELGKELRKQNTYALVLEIENDRLHMEISQTFTMLKSELPAFLFYDLHPELPDEPTKFYSKRSLKPEQLTKEYILKFIKDVGDKKIKKDLFSSEPRKDNLLGSLKHVVGKTYDKDVVEEKKNVLIAFLDSSGYCTNCEDVFGIIKNMSDKYEKESEKMLQFCTMDIRFNEPRDVPVSTGRPPFIYLYTNAMPEKKIVQFKPKNETVFKSEEIEDFLADNLKWKKQKKDDGNKSDL